VGVVDSEIQKERECQRESAREEKEAYVFALVVQRSRS
jgi:hypothetical protein